MSAMNRRAVLAGATAAAIPTAAAAALPDLEPDPAFAAIEAHREAQAKFNAVLNAKSAFEESHRGPKGKLPSGEDYAELQELERQEGELSSVTVDAVSDLTDVAPTTLAGAVALLRYVADRDFDGFYFRDSEDRLRSWSYFMHHNLADALEAMEARS